MKFIEIAFYVAFAAFIGTMITACAKEDGQTPAQTVGNKITTVVCYTKEGNEIFNGKARGPVYASYESPRVEFHSAESGKEVVISGAVCVVGAPQ